MKVAVVHFMPLEFYPPVTNIIDVFGTKDVDLKVFSTFNNKNRTDFKNEKVKINRSSFPKIKSFILIRLFHYFYFNLMTLFGLLFYRPDKIVYYESYSAWPIYVYHRFLRKVELYIHYHEYSSLEWYKTTMKLVRYYYKLEKKYLWRKANWISHTNEKRCDLFLEDHPFVNREIVYEMPNFPPKKWQKTSDQKNTEKDVLHLVYVGSLSFHDTYIQELCEWVKSQSGKVKLDIYSYNLYHDVKQFLGDLDPELFSFFSEGVDYQEIPVILSKYDVGVILYKGNTLNYVYNAPNKLFEYLVCGLEVWYPKEMLGIKTYENQLRESIKEVDFQSMESLTLGTNDHLFDVSCFTVEVASENFMEKIIK